MRLRSYSMGRTTAVFYYRDCYENYLLSYLLFLVCVSQNDYLKIQDRKIQESQILVSGKFRTANIGKMRFICCFCFHINGTKFIQYNN